MEIADTQLEEKWDGFKCPEYDGDDEEHDKIYVSQQLNVTRGEPVIKLTAECTCGWSEQRTIRGE